MNSHAVATRGAPASVQLPHARALSAPDLLGQRLSPGDVVWCAFPFHTAPREPGLYARPCLVLEERLLNGRTHYLVAYGTTKNLAPEQLFPGDLLTAPVDGEHFLATGLSGAGKFRLCQTALLPAESKYFPTPPFRVSRPSGRPVDGVRIGRLTAVMTEVLNHVHRDLNEYRAYRSLRGYEPAQPLGPHADPDALATGRDQLRRRSHP